MTRNLYQSWGKSPFEIDLDSAIKLILEKEKVKSLLLNIKVMVFQKEKVGLDHLLNGMVHLLM